MPSYADAQVAFQGGNDGDPTDLKSIKYTALKNGQIQVTGKTIPVHYDGPKQIPTVRYQFVCKQKCLIDDIIVINAFGHKGYNVSFKQELIKYLNTDDWGFCQ